MTRRDLLAMVGAAALPGFAAAAEPPAVATAAEPHHHVIAQTADLRLLRVMIPPEQSTGWHVHAQDYVVTVLRGTAIRTETLGEGRGVSGEMVTNSVSFTAYQGAPATHRVTNLSGWLNHQLAFEILRPAPGGFGPADRSHAPGFAVVLDNPRLRAWRLRLLPGAFTDPVVQAGPGLRIALSGGRVIDAPPDGPGTEAELSGGTAAILAPGTRRVVNAGNGPLDLLEFELR